jgi:Short C-terminal domain
VGEVARAPRTHGKPAGQTVCIGKAKYLEGSPYDGWPWSGLVTVSTECIEVQGRPSVPLSSISSVRLDSQQIARETIVGTSLLGVGQKLTFLTKRGELLTFQLEEQSELEVRAALTPILRLAGVPFHEELTQTPSPNAQPGGSGGPSASSIGDEIERLAELHAKGTLTDEEFAALKAKVMG